MDPFKIEAEDLLLVLAREVETCAQERYGLRLLIGSTYRDKDKENAFFADLIDDSVKDEGEKVYANAEAAVATRGFEGVAALLWQGYAPPSEGGDGDAAAVRDGLAAALDGPRS